MDLSGLTNTFGQARFFSAIQTDSIGTHLVCFPAVADDAGVHRHIRQGGESLHGWPSGASVLHVWPIVLELLQRDVWFCQWHIRR